MLVMKGREHSGSFSVQPPTSACPCRSPWPGGLEVAAFYVATLLAAGLWSLLRNLRIILNLVTSLPNLHSSSYRGDLSLRE